MSEFELVRTKSGFFSVRAVGTRETFHPVIGPAAEARKLHVEQQRLRERAQACSEVFSVWDVGLGAAANALAAVDVLRDLDAPVVLHSFDHSIRPLEFALQNLESLEYLGGYRDLLTRLLIERSVEIRPGFQWHFHLGSFEGLLYEASIEAPHAILYDPFSPKTNPELWTLQHFQSLFSRIKPGQECLWTNYSRSTLIRTALLLAGFYVGRGCALDKKEETTVASNRMSLLEDPLDRDWLLRRVRHSHSAAPLRTAAYSVAPICEDDFQKLLLHPQFSIEGMK